MGPPSADPLSRVAPNTGVRVDAWTRVSSSHVSAPYAPPAPRVGHPWPCHVASESRRIGAVVPCATSARHIITCRSVTLFRDFNKEITSKNAFKKKIKIRKMHKLQKFITLNVELLLNPSFLHWITNSLLFNIISDEPRPRGHRFHTVSCKK